MEGFDREVCRRLPLAEAVWRVFGYVCDAELLNGIFERHRGRSYQKQITFPALVQLIADVLLEHQGVARPGLERAQEQGELEASLRAVYGKLSRIPLSLSVGLLEEATTRLTQLFPTGVEARPVTASLRTFEVLVHDGKKIKNVAQRLKPLRGLKGGILGGKLVVTQSLKTGFAVAMSADSDGEAADQPLVDDLLRQVRPRTSGPRLHVVDRGFCDLRLPALFAAGEDHFVVRWHRKLRFHADPARSPRQGRDREGRDYEEDWGWIGGERDRRRMFVRRIWLRRPGEQDEVVLLTDLVDPDAVVATDLLDLYRERWNIERMFQQVTEVFHLQSLIGGTPQASVFQGAFCLLMYNIIQLVRAYVAEGQHSPVGEISTEKLFEDVERQLTAWTELLDTAATLRLLSPPQTPGQLTRRLRGLLHGQWHARWRKTPSNTHVTPQKKTRRAIKGGHTSVFRLLAKARRSDRK